MRLEKTTRRLDLSAVTPIYALTVLLFLGALVLTIWLPLKPCLLSTTTGVPCFLCGGTRASVALSQGELLGAFRWNPLVMIGWAALLGLGVLKFGFGRKVHLGLSRRALWGLGIGIVLANWIYVIASQGIG